MIEFTLDIKIVPSPRPIVTKRGTYMPKKYVIQKKLIQAKIRHLKPFGNVPLRCEFVFGFKRAKNANRNKYPVPRGDNDNNQKTVLDAMEGILYENDTLVTTIISRKVYADRDFIYIKIEEDKEIYTKRNTICN